MASPTKELDQDEIAALIAAPGDHALTGSYTRGNQITDAVYTTQPVIGDVSRDGDASWVYDGSEWQSIAVGANKIEDPIEILQNRVDTLECLVATLLKELTRV